MVFLLRSFRVRADSSSTTNRNTESTHHQKQYQKHPSVLRHADRVPLEGSHGTTSIDSTNEHDSGRHNIIICSKEAPLHPQDPCHQRMTWQPLSRNTGDSHLRQRGPTGTRVWLQPMHKSRQRIRRWASWAKEDPYHQRTTWQPLPWHTRPARPSWNKGMTPASAQIEEEKKVLGLMTKRIKILQWHCHGARTKRHLLMSTERGEETPDFILLQ